MSRDAAPRPRNVTALPNGELAIVWEDGHESYFPGHMLRCACPCASCIDEMTGRKVLVDEKIARDVRPLQIHGVGNYAISIRWSDKHDTGIYSFSRLRELCPCCT